MYRHFRIVICKVLYLFWQRNSIYARVDSALHKIRDTSEVIWSFSWQFIICMILSLWLPACHLQAVQTFAAEYLKTPLGEPVKGKKNKTTTELWVEKFYKKTTNLPEPFPHELVDRLENFLNVSSSTSRFPVFVEHLEVY